MQFGPEVDEEAAEELDEDPDPDESSEPGWRFNKELSPAIGLSTNCSNDTALGR